VGLAAESSVGRDARPELHLSGKRLVLANIVSPWQSPTTAVLLALPSVSILQNLSCERCAKVALTPGRGMVTMCMCDQRPGDAVRWIDKDPCLFAINSAL
jgi:hypothetical protein